MNAHRDEVALTILRDRSLKTELRFTFLLVPNGFGWFCSSDWMWLEWIYVVRWFSVCCLRRISGTGVLFPSCFCARFTLPSTLLTPSGENHDLFPRSPLIDESTSAIDSVRIAGDLPPVLIYGSGLIRCIRRERIDPVWGPGSVPGVGWVDPPWSFLISGQRSPNARVLPRSDSPFESKRPYIIITLESST